MGLLDGQTAIITGAASPRGLGKATAQLFAEHGCRVAILDLDAAQAEDAAADVGKDHIGLACDVTRKAECDAAVAAVLEAFGQVDILVNNAGASWGAAAEEHPVSAWDKVMNLDRFDLN